MLRENEKNPHAVKADLNVKQNWSTVVHDL